MPRYLCIQFGQCSKADNNEEIEIPAGAEPKCSQCGHMLEAVSEGRKWPVSPKITLISAAAIVVIVGVVWFVASREPELKGPQAVEAALLEVWPWLKGNSR
jgi:hypothetical protein